ncbi:hypothetical protein LTR22_013013 [Elasticomyces elasticus]|nr:hypothetical protein LTR22_013013 [Elasticomyces elasticus]
MMLRCPSTPSGTKGKLTTVLVSRPSGRVFTVELDLRGFHLYSASGVAVIIACGHGVKSPGGFEHVQYYWLKAKDVKTSSFELESYNTWKDESGNETMETPYTMPRPCGDRAGDVLESTSTKPYNATKGSVTIFVQRGHDANVPYRNLGKGQRPPTNPTVKRMGINLSPVVIAKNWFASLDGSKGLPYVFEYINVAAEDLSRADCRLRANDLTPDPDVADTGGESPHGYDAKDSDSLCESGDNDGNSSVAASDTNTNASAEDLATNVTFAVGLQRKRKRGLDDALESQHQPRRFLGGTRDSANVQPSYGKIHEADEDDEELLPTKAESLQTTTALDIAVEALAASQAPRQVTPSGAALTPGTVAELAEEHFKEEDLYGDSRHPSLYNESVVEQRNAAPPEAAKSHTDLVAVRTASNANRPHCGRSDDLAQVKQELIEPQGSEERDPTLATAEDVASDDEDDLKILAEEIRLKREDVRLQMEELQLRKKVRVLEKKRGSTKR